MNKKGLNLLNSLLLIFTIITSILRLKYIYLDKTNMLETNLSMLIYPITFIIIIIINIKYSFKEAHKSIINTIICYVIFYLTMIIFNSIGGNYNSIGIDMSLKNIFTPNYFIIFKKAIYYPNISNIIIFSTLFYFSHTIICILEEAMRKYANKFITFTLSMFIPFTLDTIVVVIINDIFKNVTFNKLIIDLTSNFIIVIITTVLLSIIYTIIPTNKKVRTKS